MEAQSAPRFMTVAEVAGVMRVSKMTVYRLIHAGAVPAVRVGKSFRVPESAARRLIERGVGSWAEDNSAGLGG